jgi:hypothetical protein
VLDCCQRLPNLPPDALADACLAYAAAGCSTSSAAFGLLLASATSNAAQLGDARLAALAGLLRRLGLRLSSAHIKHVCRAACGRVGSLPLPHLLATFHSFALMGCRPGSSHLRRLLQRLESSAELEQLEQRRLVQALVVVSELAPQPSEALMQRLCQLLRPRLPDLPAEELATLAGALSKIGTDADGATLEALAQQLRRHLEAGALGQQQLCAITRALPKLQLPGARRQRRRPAPPAAQRAAPPGCTAERRGQARPL